MIFRQKEPDVQVSDDQWRVPNNQSSDWFGPDRLT